MAKIDLSKTIDYLLSYWKNQGITSKGQSLEKIEQTEKKSGIILPQDFKEFYSCCNGMKTLYPNYTDESGFLFYPLEQLVSYEIEFGIKDATDKIMEGKQCIIFMNYLQKSWWYGILTKLDGDVNDYSIVIIPNQGKYKIISNSFTEFINEYIHDSPVLYDHE